jgi:hypothetical protein
LGCLCAGQKCCCGTRAHVELGEKKQPKKISDGRVFSRVVANEEPKEPKEREREREIENAESTRRTRRLKIEAQRRLGLKIAGDALRTPETRTHTGHTAQAKWGGYRSQERVVGWGGRRRWFLKPTSFFSLFLLRSREKNGRQEAENIRDRYRHNPTSNPF